MVKLIITPELMEEAINMPAPAPKAEEIEEKPKAKPRGRPPKEKTKAEKTKTQTQKVVRVESALVRLYPIAREINMSHDEALLEGIASDNDIASFVEKIQLLRLWLDLRDYIDDVYGEKCEYLEWSYLFEHDRIRIVDIIAYDNDNRRIEVSPSDVVSEIGWLQEINMDMLYSYRSRYWLRKDMNLLNRK